MSQYSPCSSKIILFFCCHQDFLFFKFYKQVVEYEVGDNVEVLPGQDPALVDAFIQRCNLDPEAFITVSSFFVSSLCG